MHTPPSGIVRSQPQQIMMLRGHEAVVDRLIKPKSGEGSGHLFPQLPEGIRLGKIHRHHGQGGRQQIVPHDPGNLFDKVNLPLKINPETRGRHPQGIVINHDIT